MSIGIIILIVAASIFNALLLVWHIKYWKMQFILDSQQAQSIYARNEISKRKDEKYEMMLEKYHEYIAELKSRDMVEEEKKPWEEPEWKWETSD